MALLIPLQGLGKSLFTDWCWLFTHLCAPPIPQEQGSQLAGGRKGFGTRRRDVSLAHCSPLPPLPTAGSTFGRPGGEAQSSTSRQLKCVCGEGTLGAAGRPPPAEQTRAPGQTGMEALSGATRAECFFMMSRPPAGALPLIAYILGPAGARLSRARGRRDPLPPGSTSGSPLSVPASPAASRAPVAALLTAAAALQRTSSPAAQPLHTHARTASYLEVAANSNVTYKCTPCSHPAAHLLRPPARDAQPRSPHPSQPGPDCSLWPPPLRGAI
ncbi:uncharacterized protein LOC129060920 [Pongo abelii]|uniref:uncharacterized protein LOC129060920 n=1 Tax=Pongo abelii TaxID=9601 RepID=UPI0023E8D5EA|nr:uncharacterized protein LOC129060920 [Pongo abelii]